jgi:hypothetical protein
MSWLSPPLVRAPSPLDRSEHVSFELSKELFEKNAFLKKRTAIFQLWTHVVGTLPPIPGIHKVAGGPNPATVCSLYDSVACFQGVNRPYDGEDGGDLIVIYVLNIPVSIEYNPDMVCVASSVTVPAKTPATVQVRPIAPLHLEPNQICGVVTRIEFVPGEGDKIALPRGFADRYRKRLW